MNRALKLVSVQPEENIFIRDWARALATTWAWGLCPTVDNFFVARGAWRRVEADWLRLLSGRR